jgi:hypothetical protein
MPIIYNILYLVRVTYQVFLESHMNLTQLVGQLHYISRSSGSNSGHPTYSP